MIVLGVANIDESTVVTLIIRTKLYNFILLFKFFRIHKLTIFAENGACSNN